MSRDGQKRSTTAAGRASKPQDATPTKPARIPGASTSANPPPSGGSTKPPPTSGSTKPMALVGAGAVGGIVGAVLGVLGFQNMLGPQGLAPEDSARLASIEQSTAGVSDLEAKVAAIEAEVGTQIDVARSDMETRVADIEGSVGRLDELTSALASLQEANEATSSAVTALQETGGSSPAEVAALRDASDATSSAVASLQQASDATTAQLSALVSERDQAISAAADSIRAEVTSEIAQSVGAAIVPVTTQLAAIDGQVGDLGGQLTELSSKRVPELASAQDDLGASVTSLDGKVADLSARVTALGPRVDAVAASVEQNEATRFSGAAIVLAANDVESAVRSHASLDEPAARLRSLTSDWPDLTAAIDAVESSAASSVSDAQLLSELDSMEAGLAEAAPENAADADGPSASGGWVGETFNNISGLVDAEPPVETAADDSEGAALDSARQAVAGGDLAAALEATDALDAAAVPGLAEWREHVQARLALDAALSDLGRELRNQFASSK